MQDCKDAWGIGQRAWSKEQRVDRSGKVSVSGFGNARMQDCKGAGIIWIVCLVILGCKFLDILIFIHEV